MDTPPKKFLFASTSNGLGADGALGGGEHFAIELLREMETRGWSITLVCPSISPLFSLRDLPPSITRIALDLSVTVSRPFAFLRILQRWISLVRAEQSPLLYGNGFQTLKWLAVAARLSNARTVCHLHESDYACYYSIRTRQLAARIDRFFAISRIVAKEFHRGSGAPIDHVILVPNGVPIGSTLPNATGVREEFQLANDRPLVVMVARTDPLKGHEVLLRAIPHVLVRHPQAYFLLVGIRKGSPAENQLVEFWRKLIHELEIEHSVRLEPYRADARRLMQAADVVVVPSTSEGFGRTAIEAMAEETAVIASDAGGLAEIIDHEVNGLSFSSGQSDELAAALNRLLDQPEMRVRLAQMGRKSALELYSTETMANRIESQLLGLLSAPPKR